MTGIPGEVVEHFRGVPMFSGMSKDGLRAVVTAATEIDVRGGKVIVREGEIDRYLYVIVEGRATVLHRGAKLRELGVGDFFGDLAFLDGGPRTATVTAASDMRILILSPREMSQVIEREPALAMTMLRGLATRLRTTSQAPTG